MPSYHRDASEGARLPDKNVCAQHLHGGAHSFHLPLSCCAVELRCALEIFCAVDRGL